MNKFFTLPAFFVLLISMNAWSQNTDSQASRDLEAATQEQARVIQAEVEALSQERQADFQAWRQIRRETLVLEAYNQRLQAWNQQLQEQIDRLNTQLESLDTTREQLEPLLWEMAERLQAFVRHDLPFRLEERLARVEELHQLLQRVDVSHAEKLRQLLASYRQEVSQGRELQISRELIQLSTSSDAQMVTLLRLGRVGLYYLSEDQQRAGVWQAATQTWKPLDSSQRNQVIQGIELAQERGLPQLLELPLSVPLREAGEARHENL
ncbi:DUF3450 domain-containing protein [Marinospirillum perlucidum]|uniref:DUF3450 domain-containing protein n=1 Tax=Marinospirillum perlucidum TaxID=1982602 RepID=UPI001390041B|nr:DUF3450 domain-containing protein [Marinospirillum perlucidum]